MENNNQFMDPAAMYGIPPCPGAMSARPAAVPNPPSAPPTLSPSNNAPLRNPQETMPEEVNFSSIPTNPNLPTLEEIASYNYLNAQQRRQQRDQLQQAGSQQIPYLLDNTSATYPAPPMTSRLPGDLSGPVPGSTLQGIGSPEPSLARPSAMSAPVPGSTAAITPTTQPEAVSSESLQYMNGFLRTQIGRIVQVQFLIGTNTLVDKMGILLAVGANYILINETETDDILACDFYNIKFIKFYY